MVSWASDMVKSWWIFALEGDGHAEEKIIRIKL